MFSLPLTLISTFLQRLFLFLYCVVFWFWIHKTSAAGESSKSLCFRHEWSSFIWYVLLIEVLIPFLTCCAADGRYIIWLLRVYKHACTNKKVLFWEPSCVLVMEFLDQNFFLTLILVFKFLLLFLCIYVHLAIISIFFS